MKVSVCCITYNHEKYIRDALESWISQQVNFDYEIVIGDDKSEDKTKEIIEEYISKDKYNIRFVSNNKNVGMLTNFSRTIKSCNGEYIALCEGDDYWSDPYKLQKQVDFLETNPEYGLISSDLELIDEYGEFLPDNRMVLNQREKRKPSVNFFDLLETNLINTLTVCTRTELIKPLAEKILNENLWFVYDYWFWLNIALKSKIWILDEKMAAYRVHANGMSRNSEQMGIRLHNSLFDVLTKNDLMLLDRYNEKDKKLLLNIIVRLLKSRKIKGIKKFRLFCLYKSLIFKYSK